MKFTEIELRGAYIIEMEQIEDERGFFARSWCTKDFEAHGLSNKIVQCNVSFSKKRGTLRGMHYQIKPYEEDKLVRCTKGAIYDVIIDLRQESKTYKQWSAIELTEKNRKMIYVPKGFAHGFQTLEDDTEVFYHMTEFYTEEYAKGIKWNDNMFNIKWPKPIEVISDKDMSWPDFKE